jgi:hypothetical protein
MEVRFLTDDEIADWDGLVDRSPQGCVFCESWWIKASCGDNFRILGCFRGGQLVAGIPLHFARYGFVKVCRMPKLSQSWGPVLEPMEGKYVTRLSREMELLKALADNLRRIPVFFQCFHHSLPNWLPFYWAGFRQTSIFTYILDDISDDGALWAGLRENVRTDIRKAERRPLTVSRAEPAEVLLLCDKTFKRQKMKRPFPQELFFSLVRACKERNAGQCFVARDPDGRGHAAAFLAWDKKYAYDLVSGGDPELRNSGANAFLLWWLIRFARDKSRSFDFEGSGLPQVERFFRAFGARQQPYSLITKAPLLGRVVLTAMGKL